MLGFNNFRMANMIELVSRSQKSHKYQRFQGFKFIVDVHSSGPCFKFTPHVHFAVSCSH